MGAIGLLAWAEAVLELGVLGEKLLDAGRRIQAGEHVTAEELAAAKVENEAAVDDLDEAGDHDRPDPPAEAAEPEPGA